MPDTPALQDAFGQSTAQRPGGGFPMAHLLGLFHARTGALLKLVVAPLLTHDLGHVQAVHPSLQAGDVLVAGRGLCSYAHLALLAQAVVKAGVTLPWSQGPIEGHINRLKMLKRQMFGRARLDLLARRFLLVA
jgi:hypothetical protein